MKPTTAMQTRKQNIYQWIDENANKITVAQHRSLLRVIERYGSQHVNSLGFGSASDPYVFVQVPGMCLGIETDGYTHA